MNSSLIPTVSTGICIWKIFTVLLNELVYFIPNRIYWQFHLRKIYLIYVQSLTVFHQEQSVYAYTDDVLTITASSAQTPRGLWSTVSPGVRGSGSIWNWGGGQSLASSSGLREGMALLESLKHGQPQMAFSAMWPAWGMKERPEARDRSRGCSELNNSTKERERSRFEKY